MNNDEVYRFPIGKFSPQESYTAGEIDSFFEQLEELPQKVETLIKGFSTKQVDTRYRDGGWTARQVIHHLADSHMNAYIRFKWTLTEETPLIKAYDEKAWAETPEIGIDPLISISLLKALHVKWVALLRRLKPEDLKKDFLHPETKKYIRLDRMIALYAWHGEHHLGHLKIVAEKS